MKALLVILVLAVFDSSVLGKCVKTTECKSNWKSFEGKCYGIFGEEDKAKQPYNGARTVCQDHGGDLVSIHSKEENSFIAGILYSTSGYDFYIGLYWDGTTFSLVDGTAVSYMFSHTDYYEPETPAYFRMTVGEGVDWLGATDEEIGIPVSFICKADPDSMRVPSSEAEAKMPVAKKS